MDLNIDKHVQSGRTTRMICHALANQDTPTTLVGLDMLHIGRLEHAVRAEAHKQGVPHSHIKYIAYTNRHVDLVTFRIRPHPSDAIHSTDTLIDHAVFERVLSSVISYLRNAPTSIQELVRVANMLATLGKAPYLIIEGDPEIKYAKANSLPPVKVETAESIYYYDWTRLLPDSGAHPNCVFIPDPVILKSIWGKALDEMSRWNNEV